MSKLRVAPAEEDECPTTNRDPDAVALSDFFELEQLYMSTAYDSDTVHMIGRIDRLLNEVSSSRSSSCLVDSAALVEMTSRDTLELELRMNRSIIIREHREQFILANVGDTSFVTMVNLAGPLVLADFCSELASLFAPSNALIVNAVVDLRTHVNEATRLFTSQAMDRCRIVIDDRVCEAERSTPLAANDAELVQRRQASLDLRSSLEANARSDVLNCLIEKKAGYDIHFQAIYDRFIFGL